MDQALYNSYAEIDMAALDRNWAIVAEHVGPRVGVIPVLKANAYGHGLAEMARYFAREKGAPLLAVGQLLEGVAIRRAGVRDTEVLVMSGLPEGQLADAVAHDIQFALFDTQTAEALSRQAARQGRVARVQIKIETGMGRIGVRPGQALESLLDTVAGLGHLEITGFFTHFSTAETIDEPYAAVQYERFQAALAQADARGLALRYRHCCNTAAATWFPKGHGTHIRAGCMLLGYPSIADFSNPLGLVESMSWRTSVQHIHTLAPGESCGYDRHFVADRPTRVAVINVGYGDGIYLPFAHGGGPVLVGEVQTRFLAVCMDMSLIDVTDLPCRPGDEVTLAGRSRGGAALSFSRLAELTGQPCTYPMVGINHRVARVYVNG